MRPNLVYFVGIVAAFASCSFPGIVQAKPEPGLLDFLGLGSLLGLGPDPPRQTTQAPRPSSSGLLGLGHILPILSILPSSIGLQSGDLLKTLLGLVSNPDELLKLNLTLSPLDLNKPKKFKCPAPLGIFADPDDCSSFFICVLGVVQLRLSCSPGTHYEPGLLALCLPNDPVSSLPDRCNRCPPYSESSRNCTNSPYGCSFCFEPGFQGGPRCDTIDNLRNHGCKEIYNKPDPDEGDNVTIGGNNTNPNVSINLLPGDKKNITITIQLKSHPVDIYLLMDISGSMGDDKANVVALSEKLAAAAGNISKDWTLGFGCFSDKVDAFTFRHVLKLSNDSTNFSRTVQDTRILWGGDTPEDAGTAMFEAAACEAEIGWRPPTRRILLVITDASFHIGRDNISTVAGRAAFDGKCHLDANGIYTERLTQDYPSLSQLVRILAEKRITVIFGVASEQNFYEDISKQIRPSAVGLLSWDSSNLIQLLDKEYKKIASRVEMTASGASKEIQFKYYSTCSTASVRNSTIPVTEQTICEVLTPEGQLTFLVEVSVKECPKNETDWKQTIKVRPAGLPEHLEISLQLVCQEYWSKR